MSEIIEILSSDDEDPSENRLSKHSSFNQTNTFDKSITESRYNCPFAPNCGFLASTFESFLDHLAHFHPSNEKYICLYCKQNNNLTKLNVTPLYLGQLQPHVEILHKNIVNFKPENIEQPKTKPISRNLPAIQRVPVDQVKTQSMCCPISACHLHKNKSLSSLEVSRHLFAFHPACLFWCTICPPITSLYSDGAMNTNQIKIHVDRLHNGNYSCITDKKPVTSETSFYSNSLSMSPRQLMNSTLLQTPIYCPISECRYHTPPCAIHSSQVPYECSHMDRCKYDRPKDFFNHLMLTHDLESNFLCKSCYDCLRDINSSMTPSLLLNHMLQTHGGCFKGVHHVKKCFPVPIPTSLPSATSDVSVKPPNEPQSVISDKSEPVPFDHANPSQPCNNICFVPGCTVTRQFSNMENVLAHVIARHPNSRFNCQQCDFVSREKPLLPSELKLHLDSCHNGKISTISVFISSCFVAKCQHRATIQSHDQLLNHIGYHHASSKFSCKLCSPLDNSMAALEMKQHVFCKHKGFTNYIFELLTRSDNDDNDSDLEITDEIIPVKKTIDCSKCSMSFNRIDEYHNHVAESHQEMQFLCNSCRQLFKTLDEMRRHRLEVHPNELLYRCNRCHSFTAPDVHQLRLHQSSCRVECIYRCVMCGFTSHDEAAYKTHLAQEAHRRAMNRKKANKYVKAAHNQIMKKGSKPDIMVDKFTGQIFVGGQPLAPARNLSYRPPKKSR